MILAMQVILGCQNCLFGCAGVAAAKLQNIADVIADTKSGVMTDTRQC
jgi:hypothetical protein